MAAPTTSAPSVTEVSGNTTTPTFNIPAHDSGDMVLLIIGSDGDNSPTSFDSLNGASWTTVATTGTDRTAVSWHLAYLRAAADQATPTTIGSSWAQGEQYVCHAYRVVGTHATSAPEASWTGFNSGQACNPPSLTPSWGNEENLWFTSGTIDNDGGNGFSAAPTNYTTNATITNSSGTANCSHGTSWRTATATSEDPDDWTKISNDISWGATVAVRGAAGGGSVDVTVSTTLDGLTAAASVAQSVDLTASVTLAGLTAAGQLAQAFDVTVSAQLEGLTAAAQAASGTSVDVTVSTTLDGLTASVTAAQAVDLTADITLDGLTAAAQLAQAVSVTVSAALDGLEVSAETAQAVDTAVATTLDGLTVDVDAESLAGGESTVSVTLEGVEVSAAVQQAVSVAVSVALEGLAAEAGLDLTEIRFTFTPPTRGPRSQVTGTILSQRTRRWRRFVDRVNEVEYGTNVWQDSEGQWHEGIVDTSDDTHLVVYLGGKTHEVTEAEKTALEAAGYTVVTE